MSRRSNRMVRDVGELVERIDEVTRVLSHYGQMCADLAHNVDRGQSLEEAFAALDGPVQKRQVTDVLSKLEQARHRVRLSVFALAEEQSTSASEVGRQLGISRQLASRLAQEARGANGRGRSQPASGASAHVRRVAGQRAASRGQGRRR